MRIGLPLYDGDGIDRSGSLVALTARVLAPAEPSARSPFAVIGDALRDLFRRLEGRVDRMHYRELERYLAGSGDVLELEQRMRDLERRHGAGFNSFF